MADQERVVKITIQAGSSEQALKQLQRELQKAENRLDKFGKKAANDAGSGIQTLGKKSGAAGVQIQQLVGQLQGGQDAMLALSQQGADLGIVLGAPLVGAIIGISASLAGMLLPELLKTNDAFKTLKENTDDLTTNYNKLTESGKAFTMVALSNQLKEQVKTWTEADKKVKELTKSLNEAIDPATALDDWLSRSPKAIRKDLADAQSSLELIAIEYKRLLKLRDDLLNAPAKALSDVATKLKSASDADKDSAGLSAGVDAGLISKAQAELTKRQEQEIQAFETMKKKELDTLVLFEEQKLIAVDMFAKRKGEIEAKHEKQTASQIALEKKTLAEKEVMFKKNAVVTTIGLGKQLMSASQGQSKALFEASKALSLASAIASLPSAVMESFKNNGGMPWGIPAAVAMAATGASQIASIAQTKFTSKSSTATSPSGGAVSTGASFSPPSQRNTQTETTSGNALLNELRQWNGSDLIPVEYARRIAESLAEVNRQGGY